MKLHRIIGSLALAGLSAAPAAAQSATAEPAFTLGARVSVTDGLKASFRNLGGFAAQTNIGAATGAAADRFYDNGFVRVDGSGNAGGLTTYWSYNEAAQVQGDNLVFYSHTAAADISQEDLDLDPSAGLELTALWPVGRSGFGIFAAVGLTNFDLADTTALSGDVLRTADAYALGGIIPPAAPYTGTAAGPGPLLGSTPTRSTSTLAGAAALTGRRELDGHLLHLTVGPAYTLALGDAFLLRGSAGLALGQTDLTFVHSETVTITGVGAQSRTESADASETSVGFYGEISGGWQATEALSLNLGLRFLKLDDLSAATALGKVAELAQDELFQVSLGFGYRF